MLFRSEITKSELPYLPGDVIGKITVTMDDGYVVEGELSVDAAVQPLEYFDLLMKSFKEFLV